MTSLRQKPGENLGSHVRRFSPRLGALLGVVLVAACIEAPQDEDNLGTVTEEITQESLFTAICLGTGTGCGNGVCDGTEDVLGCPADCAVHADGVVNYGETDVDCGGPSPLGCANGKACSVNGDCQGNSCVALTCAAATCSDGVKNGTETDVDCGGASCKKCAYGRTCLAIGDCQSGICDTGICVLVAGPCSGVANVTDGTVTVNTGASPATWTGNWCVGWGAGAPAVNGNLTVQ
jgi:hypothetical protein